MAGKLVHPISTNFVSFQELIVRGYRITTNFPLQHLEPHPNPFTYHNLNLSLFQAYIYSVTHRHTCAHAHTHS